MSYGSDKQGKTELNISSHQQKDKDKSGDYAISNVGGADKDKAQEKHEKTSITFERKKCDDKTCQDKEHQHSWNKDKDLNKDLNKDLKKDKEFHYESKDLNKDKDWNKDLHKDKDWNKDKEFNKDLHKDKEMHDRSDENKGGIINTIKEKVKDVLGAGDNDKSKDKEKDVHMSTGAGAGVDYNKQQHKDEKFGSSNVGVGSGSGQYQQQSNLSSDKQFVGSAAGSGYSGAGQATVDHKNLGAEHREAGYDKQSNVIPSKEKDKDTAHKVDIHGSLYTSGAGSTYKTNEAK